MARIVRVHLGQFKLRAVEEDRVVHEGSSISIGATSGASSQVTSGTNS